MNIRRLLENYVLKPLLTGTWPSSSTDLAWISVAGIPRITFFAQLATTAPDGTVELVVRQAKDTSGTGAKDVTENSVTCKITNTSLVNASTLSGKWVAIELETRLLDRDNDYDHVTVAPAETATGSLTGAIYALWPAVDRPPTQTASEIVNFDG